MWTHARADTHRHISVIDIVCVAILITYHVCAVGGISCMSMRMCETSWHPQHLQGQSESALVQLCASIKHFFFFFFFFLKQDQWHPPNICFCQSNKTPLNQRSPTHLPLIYRVDEDVVMFFTLSFGENCLRDFEDDLQPLQLI